MTYAEAMERYGTDKPDLRFGLELIDLTALLRRHAVPGVPGRLRRCGGDARRGRASRGGRSTPGRSSPSSAGTAGWPTSLVGEDGELGGPVAKNLSEAERDGPGRGGRRRARGLRVLRRGPRPQAQALLGAARLEIGRRGGLIDESAWSFLLGGRRAAVRAGRRAVAAGDVAVGVGRLDRGAPRLHLAQAGVAGHLRHRPGLGAGLRLRHRLQRQRDRRRLDPYPPPRHPGAGVRGDGAAAEEAQEKFGFLLDAFAFGAPPHGGIAFGWDRICALLSGTDSIREVIAFPKTGGGFDPLTGAPAPITAAQRKEAGVDGQARPACQRPAGPSRLAGDRPSLPAALGAVHRGRRPSSKARGQHRRARPGRRVGVEVAGAAAAGSDSATSRGQRHACCGTDQRAQLLDLPPRAGDRLARLWPAVVPGHRPGRPGCGLHAHLAALRSSAAAGWVTADHVRWAVGVPRCRARAAAWPPATGRDAAGRADAAAHPGRDRRPAPPARPGLAAAPAPAGEAAVGVPVGTARHRQDDDRPGRRGRPTPRSSSCRR